MRLIALSVNKEEKWLSDFRVEDVVCLSFEKSDFHVERTGEIGYSLDERGAGNGGNIFIVFERSA